MNVSASKPPAMDGPRPVVLVHGWCDTERKMLPLARRLRDLGHSVWTPCLAPSDGKASLATLAEQLAHFLADQLPPDARPVLAGFSMGGLICRYYVQKLGGTARTSRLITISSPHRGSVLAFARNGPGALDMRPNSPFLLSLNADIETLRTIEFASIWTPLDLMIVPAASSRLGIGYEEIVWSPAHPLMVLGTPEIRRITRLVTCTHWPPSHPGPPKPSASTQPARRSNPAPPAHFTL